MTRYDIAVSSDAWTAAGPSNSWLEHEAVRLLGFPVGGFPPGGGAQWLDSRGHPDAGRPIASWISARMAYVYALGALEGRAGALERSREALGAFHGLLHDDVHGGWFEDTSEPRMTKTAYTHAFVVLAATAGVATGQAGSDDLLAEALQVIDRHFWEEGEGLVRDACTADWTVTDAYRGLNANMHLVEAYLAAGEFGYPALHRRALRICARVARWASAHRWRLPEHFDASWTPLLEYNRERPSDPFKPFGSTPGHGFEWARLLLQASLVADHHEVDALRVAAARLYSTAATDGWARTGERGFVYTVDWTGRPVSGVQLFWVAAEAVIAASAFTSIRPSYRVAQDAAVWWSHIRSAFVDETNGSWVHEVDSTSRPASTIWFGKPDLYHAYQACVFPRFELSTTLLRAVQETT